MREFSDQLAERLRALNAQPDGRIETVTATTHLPSFPAGEVLTTDAINLITERLNVTVENIRAVHDDVDEEDPPAPIFCTFSSRTWSSTRGWPAPRIGSRNRRRGTMPKPRRLRFQRADPCCDQGGDSPAHARCVTLPEGLENDCPSVHEIALIGGYGENLCAEGILQSGAWRS